MTDAKQAISVQCPKCKSSYRMPETFRGKATCKKCGVAFIVGVPEGERRAAKARAKAEERTAKQLMIVGGVVLVVVGGLIAILSSQGRPPPADIKPVIIPSQNQVQTQQPRQPAVLSSQPEKVARQFFRALATLDRGELSRLFDVHSFYKWWDGETKNRTEPAERFENLAPEVQAARSELAIEALMDVEMAEALSRGFLPSLEKGSPDWSKPPRIEGDFGSFDVLCKDDSGKPLLSVQVTAKLRQGRSLPADLEIPEAWGIYRIDTLWHQSTLKNPKADKRAVDLIEERRRERERRELAGRPRGPVEVEPQILTEVAGTGPTQREAIEKNVRTLLDEAAGREFHVARDQLIHLGKASIPFLLNALVGKNHKDNDKDIRDSFMLIQVLDEITGQGTFGYSPTQARESGVGVTTSTSEERERAVRRWFGWWSRNKDSFTKKAAPPEEEEDIR